MTADSNTQIAQPLVQTFNSQPHATSIVPEPSKHFKAEILETRIKDQDVIRLSKLDTLNKKTPQIVSIDIARGAGFAPIAWTVALPDGRSFNLTGARPASEIDARFAKDKSNVFRDNLFFQSGVVATLFPMTNRLTGRLAGDRLIEAMVEGQRVVMPLNNRAGTADAIPHHLHGLLFGQLANDVGVKVLDDLAQARGSFKVGPEMWTGQTSVETTHELTANGYVFHLKVKNIGATPVPVGAGAHPYFASPDFERDSMRVHVPAKSLVEIDNLSNVLPTGKISLLKDVDPALNFAKANGVLLHEREIANNSTSSRLDNLWVDLQKDANGFAYCEVFYPHSRFKVRMTALTKNVIGIQGYAPKYEAGKNPFVALELVTNLPDPRKELWGSQSTGMKLLNPGETFEYGYKVEVTATK